MKYWNKDKEIRKRCWTAVSKPKTTPWVGSSELKRWCQNQPSNGKFYFYYGSQTWWFERPEDATWFVLHWS